MPSIRAVPKLDFTGVAAASSSASTGSSRASDVLLTSSSTEMPMGSIMTAVAVFETHMDRKPVAIMNPAIICGGLVPISRTVSRAMRRCRFQRCMASASRKPPMNRKMTLLP